MLRNLGYIAAALALLASASSPIAQAEKNDVSFNLATSFATKTAYYDQSKDTSNKLRQFVQLLDEEEEDKYTLVQVQQVVRHGTRYPTESNIEEIQEFLTRLQTDYASVLPAWLKNYKLPYDVSIEGLLSPSGAVELEKYGSRTRKSVGKAIPKQFSADKFILQHTYKPRTKNSAISFASKFFENAQNVTYIEYPKKNDPLLRFFDQCPRYERDVKENPEATVELTKYKETPAFLKNIETLRTSLNLPKDAPISPTDVESAFSACAFDLALSKTENNWCTLLTPEFIKSVEYAEELEAFYEESHGNKLNYEIASVLVKDVFKFMKDFVEGKTQVVGNFRFAHGETTLPLMTLLGYVDQTKLLASFTSKEIAGRKFRTSRLALFMANVEFRLYKKNKKQDDDDDDDDDDKAAKGKKEKFYAQIRVNEQVTTIPGCDDEIFCELSDLEQIWGYYLNEYNFEKDCAV